MNWLFQILGALGSGMQTASQVTTGESSGPYGARYGEIVPGSSTIAGPKGQVAGEYVPGMRIVSGPAGGGFSDMLQGQQPVQAQGQDLAGFIKFIQSLMNTKEQQRQPTEAELEWLGL